MESLTLAQVIKVFLFLFLQKKKIIFNSST